MATYMGHKPHWKQHFKPSGGPLRPPTPVEPRGPPTKYTPLAPGSPDPTNRYNKYRPVVLPGPGPKAGGRYKAIPHGWNPAAPYNPRGVNPIPGKYFGPIRRGIQTAGRFAGLLSRFNTFGKALSLGFDLLDMWQVTQQPTETFAPGTIPSGWVVSCYDADPTFKWDEGFGGINQAFLSCPGGVCDEIYINPLTSGPYARYSGTNFQIRLSGPTGTKQSTLLGPSNGVPGASERFAIKLKVCRVGSTAPAPDMYWDPWIRTPAIVQPMPGTLTPPAPVWEEGPRTEPRPRTTPRTSLRPEPGTSPTPAPGPKGGGDKLPPVIVRHPKTDEIKWKITDPRIADLWGKLSEAFEIGDCLAKMTDGFKSKPGEAKMMKYARLVQYLHDHPEKLHRNGFIDCVVENHIQDAVIGKANQLANQITKNHAWRRPVGVGRGGFSSRWHRPSIPQG